MGHACFHRRQAVTLLEVILAMSLLVVLTTMTYWFYGSALETRARDTDRAKKLQLVRVVLQRMATEVRQAIVVGRGDGVGIVGQAESIAITSLRVPSRELSRERLPREPDPPAEFDLVDVEYHIARHPDILHEEKGYEKSLGLTRVERRLPGLSRAMLKRLYEGEAQSPDDITEILEEEGLLSEDEGAGNAGFGLADEINWEELYSTDIRYLRFCYYDGYSWWDSWEVSGENPLPQLVMITIGFEMHPPFDAEFGEREEEAEEFCTCMNREPTDCEPLPPDQLATTVRVAQADTFFRSRITRETQSMLERVEGDEAEEEVK